MQLYSDKQHYFLYLNYTQPINIMDRTSKIAIVGAGISGLALSIALRQNGFKNVQIFDKDASFDRRRQGYGLTILQGKSALRKLGVFDQVKKYNAHSKAHYIFNWRGQILGFYGTLFWDHKNNQRSLRSIEKGLSMHVPRQSLRKVLLDTNQLLSKQQIKWGQQLTSIEFTKKSAALVFNNKEGTYQADIVFGCDGIYSSVRRASVFEETPLNYLGVIVVLGLCSVEHGLNKNRVFQTADGYFRLFTMPFIPNHPHLSSMWQLSFRMDFQSAKYYSSHLSELKQLIYTRLSKWHEPIPEMIALTQLSNITPIIAYDRDAALPVLKDPRIILLGDALHPMSPFKGQGANQALIDAVDVPQQMSSCTTIPQMNKCVEKMVNRASLKVLSSRQRVLKYHQPSFTEAKNFIYPGVDERLIRIVKQKDIGAKDGALLQQLILKVMKQHEYI